MKKARTKAIWTIIIFFVVLLGSIYVSFFGVADRGKAKYISLGLDLKGGLSVSYEIQDESYSDADVDDTIYKLQKRIDSYTTEHNVYSEGNGKITAEIPGVTDADAILEDLSIEGKLEFLDPDNYTLWASGEDYEAALTGDDIKGAEAGIESTETGEDNVVQLTFTDEGAEKFAEVTEANVGDIIYIVYDNEVVSAPTVQSAIMGGNAEINNISSYEEADELATTIRIGALPLTLTQVRSNIVGATLGSNAIQNAIKAGIIGIIGVFLIMILVYRIPGVIASFALVLYIFFDLMVMNLFNVTLTLPGIAGIILSIGMAVDANVVIFTRIKEELRDGASTKEAVKTGFHNALSAIIDGNVTTLIAAFVLYVLGTGTIKGFAITLAIGIVLSVFTALVISQSLLNALVTLGLSNPKHFGVAKQPGKVDYVKIGKYCILCSVLFIVVGFFCMPIFSKTKGSALNLSIDFAGGTSLTVDFDKAYTLSEAENEIVPVIAEAAGISEADISVQTVSGSNEIMFKTTELTSQGEDSQVSAVTDALSESFGAEVTASDNISGSASKDMLKDAGLSVALAAVLMLIYVAIRFKTLTFGTSAVLALCHDVCCVFVFYILLRLSVGNTCIACMLTIFGYSINSTIIIYDRIRENIALTTGKKDYREIVNLSVNQTLTRNIYTNLTTFVTIFVLYVMGVPSIKEFSFALMAGVVVGAYSSICISGPLWYYFRTAVDKRRAKKEQKLDGAGKQQKKQKTAK